MHHVCNCRSKRLISVTNCHWSNFRSSRFFQKNTIKNHQKPKNVFEDSWKPHFKQKEVSTNCFVKTRAEFLSHFIAVLEKKRERMDKVFEFFFKLLSQGSSIDAQRQ
jgi:hypothetical protein